MFIGLGRSIWYMETLPVWCFQTQEAICSLSVSDLERREQCGSRLFWHGLPGPRWSSGLAYLWDSASTLFLWSLGSCHISLMLTFKLLHQQAAAFAVFLPRLFCLWIFTWLALLCSSGSPRMSFISLEMAFWITEVKMLPHPTVPVILYYPSYFSNITAILK